MTSSNFKSIWLYGMPRSGTNWISQIFASSPDVRLKFCPLFSYEFKEACNEKSSKEEWFRLLSSVYQTSSEFLDQQHLRKKGLIPTFNIKNDNPEFLVIKSNRYHHLVPNLLEQLDELRVIYLVRNPCASLYSWFNDPKEFPHTAEPINEWREGNCRKGATGEFWGFNDWVSTTKQAKKLSTQWGERHKIIRYEEFVDAPLKSTERLFGELGLNLSSQTKDFINLAQTVHHSDPHSVYKGNHERNLWRKNMDKRIIRACYDELSNTQLEDFL